MGFDKTLKESGYNLRERANIYAGATVGFLAPIVAAKYLITSGMSYEKNWQTELIGWGAAAATNLIASVSLKGVPLVYSTVTGLGLGGLSANSLRRKRLDRVGSLENISEQNVLKENTGDKK